MKNSLFSLQGLSLCLGLVIAAHVNQARGQTILDLATGSLTTARYHHVATLLPNGKVLVTGGFGSVTGSYLSSAETYDPVTGAWSTSGAMMHARFVHTATLLNNGLVLAVGGYGGSGFVPDGGGSYLSSAELYNPATGTWTPTGSLSGPRYGHTATLLPNGKVLVAGGNDGPTLITSAELYDPATGTWTTTGSPTTTRLSFTATLLTNGLVLIAGGQPGHNSASLASAELFNPATGTWSATGSLNAARATHTATLLPNGMVLVTSGYSNTGTGSLISSTELFNPVTGTWSTSGSLNTARVFHSAALLPSGMVLVAGGADSGGSRYSSAELFSSVTGTWTNTISLQAARGAFTATSLADGRVLVAAGIATGGSSLASAELIVESPAITAQPISITPAVGAATNLSATVTGSALAYQWFKDGVNLPGANAATLAFASVQPPQIGNYFLVVTNAAGSVTSSVVTVTIPGVPTGVWQGLLAYYPFNGNANDGSTFGNHGTAIGSGVGLVNDRFGTPSRAYSFTNTFTTLNRIDCGDPSNNIFDLTGDATISTWIQPASGLSPRNNLAIGPIVAKDQSAGSNFKWIFGANSDGFSMFIEHPGVGSSWAHSSPFPVTAGQMYHVVVTKSGNAYLFFVDGVNIGGQSATVSIPDVPANLTIGAAEIAGNPLYYNGLIDDVRIYNRTLSAAEVAQLHASEALTPLTVGLAAYYPFSGTANDESGNGNHGTVQEAALGGDRFTQASRAYNFDGVNDQIVVAHSASVSPTNEVTTAAWIRPLAYEDNKHVVSKGSHVNYFSRSYSLQGPWADGKWRATLSTPTGEVVVASSASATLSQWSHVLMSYDGATVKLYVNGVLSSSQAATGLITQTSEPLLIGSHKFYAASDYWFNGGIDDVRIYNRAFSAAEVAQLHASEAAAPPVITTQPTSASANVGSSATFTVTATGTAPLAYQWRKDGVNLSGATGATLGLLNVQTNQAGSYSVVITNAWGSITSSVAALTVNRLAQTITFGALPGKRLDDSPFSLSATANSGLTVSFSSSVTSVATVSGNTVTITGVGSTTITASQVGDATYLPATSVTQALVVSAPPSIGTQPSGQTFTLGSAVTLSVGAAGTGPLSYQWQFNGVNIAGANAATLALTNLNPTNAGAYRVVITNAVGTATSNPVDLYFYGDLKFIAATVLAGSIGQQYRVDYADVVTVGTTNWLVLTNVTLPSSPFLVIDPNSAGRTQRYYRAVPLP